MALLFFSKKYFYTDHFIYAIRFFSVILLLALIQSALVYLLAWLVMLGKIFWTVVSFIILFYMILYAFISVKKVYGQKTISALFLILPVTFFLLRHTLFIAVSYSLLSIL
jgi:hypothetical protein